MSDLDAVLRGAPRDLGGFQVRRVLPSMPRRLVGPFIFFDHMGPAELPPGHGLDVRPHPHIGLATVTYLFDGELIHRDTLGSEQAIVPGDVNWMVAGRGVAHSERLSPERRARGVRMHGIQSWVALPTAHEECEPRFEHHPAGAMPVVRRDGVVLRVIAGTAYGVRAPTGVLSPTLCVHAAMDDGATLLVDDEHEQRAIYVVEGSIAVGAEEYGEGSMLVLRAGAGVAARARGAAHVMLVGGAPLDGPRHVWWNFVSSSEARIEQAKAEWRAGGFGAVLHDEEERIPLPE